MSVQVSLESLSGIDDETMRAEDHIISELLVDVLSVVVYSDSLEECKYCSRVYGTVVVNDSLSSQVCVLYNRHKNDCETISVDNRELSLINEQKYSRIGLMKAPVIHVYLKDEKSGSVVVQCSQKLENIALDTGYFEEFRYEVMQNEGGGYAIVKYVVLRYGVFAQIDVELMTKTNNTSIEHHTLDVYGSITGHFGKACKSNVTEHERRASYYTLFHKLEYESHCWAFGSTIPLCREIFTVPSYSNFIIRLDLKEGGTQKEVAVENLEFKPSSCGLFREYSERRGFGDVFVQVSVAWHDLLSIAYDYEAEPNYIDSFDIVPHPVRRLFGFQYIEVFSILIGHDNHDPLRIHGTVCTELTDSFDIFLRGNNEPPLEIKDNLLPLSVSNEALMLRDNYIVYLYIQDVTDRVIIKGYFDAPVEMARRQEEWFDRRFCSVVRGVGGFAAVHYMVHKCAIRAVVNVKLISADSSPLIVHGHIVTSYSHLSYDTTYEKEYYRAYLFKKSEADAVVVSPNFTLPLSRCLVTVPLNSALIVEVKMNVSFKSSNETIVGTLKFGIGKGEDISRRINGGTYALIFSVVWK